MNPPEDKSALPPKVYRVMKRDVVDGLPVVGFTGSSQLGARPEIDFSVDDQENVVLDGSGISVAPNWRDIHFTRIPRRLRHLVPGATGGNGTSCYTMGEGPFRRETIADGLELIPDEGPAPITHGVIAPQGTMSATEYQKSLASTRNAWRIDET